MRLEALTHPGVHHEALDGGGVAPHARGVVHVVEHDPLGPQLGGHYRAVVEAG